MKVEDFVALTNVNGQVRRALIGASCLENYKSARAIRVTIVNLLLQRAAQTNIHIDVLLRKARTKISMGCIVL